MAGKRWGPCGRHAVGGMGTLHRRRRNPSLHGGGRTAVAVWAFALELSTAAMERAAAHATTLYEREGLLWCEDGLLRKFLCEGRGICGAGSSSKEISGGGDALPGESEEGGLGQGFRFAGVSNHMFSIVPDTDIDEPLVWETLYVPRGRADTPELRSIADIRVSAAGDVRFLKRLLPIAVVESWKGLSERSLQHVAILAILSLWEMQALGPGFWDGLIKGENSDDYPMQQSHNDDDDDGALIMSELMRPAPYRPR